MKLIKRYSNRKLYDTERSCYVTLEEIAVMVRDGEEVSIIDNRTGEDLTTVTLAQIVFEEEKRDRRMLPIQTLRMIIQTPGEFIQRLAKPVADLREQTQNQVERLRRQAQAQQEEIVSPLRDFAENVQRKVDEMQVHFDQRLKDAVDALTHVPDLASELGDLKRRLATAEAEVDRLRGLAGLEPLPQVEEPAVEDSEALEDDAPV
jgi:polyhydroxyalkanoate synthesis repressor PhaR